MEVMEDVHLQTSVRLVVYPIHVQPLYENLWNKITRKTGISQVLGSSEMILQVQSAVCTQFGKIQFLENLQAS